MLDRQKVALASSLLSLQPECTLALEEGGQNSCGGVTTCGLTSVLYLPRRDFLRWAALGAEKNFSFARQTNARCESKRAADANLVWPCGLPVRKQRRAGAVVPPLPELKGHALP